MISNEIIALARRFADMGGTKEHVWKEDDQVLLDEGDGVVLRLEGIEDDTLWMNDNYGRYNEDCIPILSPDELWAWLCTKTPDYHFEFCNCREPDMPNQYRMLITHFKGGIEADENWIELNGSLHYALYSAVVWVAEKEAS